jgi:hypothetical protein
MIEFMSIYYQNWGHHSIVREYHSLCVATAAADVQQQELQPCLGCHGDGRMMDSRHHRCNHSPVDH